MIQLDTKDRKLLYYLNESARYANTELSKKIHLSKDAVAYRINKLEEQGIIRGYHTNINFRKIGYETYRIGLHLINFNQEQENHLIEYLKAKDSIWGISVNEGVWTVSYLLSVQSMAELYRLDTEILNTFRDIISKRHITPMLHVDFLPRNYLIDHTPKKKPKQIQKTAQVEIDELDKNILNHLQKNARAKLIDMAQEFDCSSSLILQRMRKLEANKVILGYSAAIDVLKLGRDYYGVKVILNNRDEYEQIQTHIYGLQEMTGYLYSMGEYDFEFDIEVTDTQHYREIINEMKKHFNTIREITYLKTNRYILQELQL